MGTEIESHWVCEWHDNDAAAFVGDHPTECKVRYCAQCKCETWHAPRHKLTPEDKGEK